MRFFLFFCGVLALLPLTTLHAQLAEDIMGEAVSVTLEPQYPSPGDTVIATLDDYSINSGGSTISWYINGVESTSVRNQRTITFTADISGAAMNVEVRLNFANRPMLSASRMIKPAYFDLIVEPLTFTPVFYAGRALPAHGSLVTLTALFHTTSGLVNHDDYTYNWQLNDKSMHGGPQKGKHQTQMTVPYGRSSIITVSIQDAAGTTVARKLVSIPSVPVDLEFYAVSTLYGLSHKVVGEKLTLVGNSSTIRAVPYNLDRRATGNRLFSEWSIDGRANKAMSGDPLEINLRQEGAGNARVSFKLRNLSELIQSDEQSFQVQF